MSTACQVLEEDFYINEVLSGSVTIEEFSQLQQKLRKWIANGDAVVAKIPESDQLALDISTTEAIKTLGQRWNPVEGTFTFKVNLNSELEGNAVGNF